VVAVAIAGGPDGRETGTAPGGAGKRAFRGAFRGALRRVDELVERRIPIDEDAFVTMDARPLLERVPVLRLRRLPGARRFASDDIAALSEHDLDVLLWLGDRGRPRGGILRAARAGAWSFHLGDPE